MASQSQALQVESKLIVVHFAKVSQLASLIQSKRKNFLSKQGVIAADERTNSLWVRDVPSRVDMIDDFIKKIDTPVNQVLIKARIVNADTSKESEIGARLGVARTGSVSEHLKFDMPANSLFKHPGSAGLAITNIGHGVHLDLELSAMEREHMLDVVASPRLLTSHRQPALIESGTEIPYEQQTKEGGTNASFKKAVLSLKVTPKITANKQVILTLEVNQDKPGANTTAGLTIDTQHMKTQVLVRNGQTIVVGGIYETITKNMVTRVPFLGELPLVGALFRHKVKVNDRKELLIFITPEIVHA